MAMGGGMTVTSASRTASLLRWIISRILKAPESRELSAMTTFGIVWRASTSVVMLYKALPLVLSATRRSPVRSRLTTRIVRSGSRGTGTRRLTKQGSIEGTTKVNTENPAASREAVSATSPRRNTPCPDQLVTETLSLVPGRTSVPGPIWVIVGNAGVRDGLNESGTAIG